MINAGSAFLRVFCCLSVALIMLIMLFNAFVNPFGLVETPPLSGFNAVKPRMFSNARMVKAHHIRQKLPRGLVMGSSRAETGLDPEHWGWAVNAKPVYNAALPSARIYEIYKYLQHANAQTQLKQVVVGLDFFMFDARFPNESGFELTRLDSDGKSLLNPGVINDFLMALLSYDSLLASKDTLLSQSAVTQGYLANGSQDSGRRRDMIRAKGGHFAAFEATLRSSLLDRDGVANLEYGHEDGRKAKTIKWFRNIVRFCVRENIELYILISPAHAQWLEVLWHLDDWDDFEDWKRDITQVVNLALLEGGKGAKVELWDFSGYNAMTKEIVPQAGTSVSEMRWYWEASHYKRKLGNLMLDRIFGGKTETELQDFGVRLKAENIEAHLRRIREARSQYADERPNDIEYVRRIVAGALCPPGYTDDGMRQAKKCWMMASKRSKSGDRRNFIRTGSTEIH